MMETPPKTFSKSTVLSCAGASVVTFLIGLLYLLDPTAFSAVFKLMMPLAAV